MCKLAQVAPPFGAPSSGLDRLDEHLLRDVGLMRRHDLYVSIGEAGGKAAMRLPSLGTLAFAALCIVWGSTWVPIKFALERVDPVTLAGTRFVAAGLILLGLALASRGTVNGTQRQPIRPKDLATAALLSVATVAVSYGLLFWSMAHLPSGLVAVVNLSLIPVGLYGFGLAFAVERVRVRRIAAMPIGGLGLWLLMFGAGPLEIGASAAIPLLACVVATAIYCLGAVASRPLVSRLGPIRASGLQMICGGILLVPVSILDGAGHGPADLIAPFTDWSVFGAWSFLVLFGSVFGFTVYLKLMRDLGPVRAGAYAYVSPIVALALGALTLGERITSIEFLAAAILLAAAVLAVGGGEGGTPRPRSVAPRLSMRGT